MSLADYLAKNYLTADKPTKTKKRKRKEAAGFSIADDSVTGWEASSRAKDEDDRPALAVGRSAEFRKTKANNWTSVGVAAPSDADQAAADAILSTAAREQAAQRAREENDEAPVVEGADEDEEDAVLMASGAHAGLQTAAQVNAAEEKKRRRERRAAEAADAERGGLGGETIYRDASGRVINVAMKRAEARRKELEELERKQREVEEAKGDVQRLDKEKRKQLLEDAKYMPFARGADDVEMNEELKEKGRWNDPAAGFVEAKEVGKSATGRPLYQGAAAPNRYGIRPGHRWDGVDRSNGFEKEWFKARNKVEDRKNLEYQWQMDE